MQRKMRRSDREISAIETREILQKGEYGILSTVSPDGQPYGIPVSYAASGDILYFHCAVEGHKVDNIQANSRVSFCVVGKTQLLPDQFATRYESAVVFGTAVEITGAEKHAGLTTILQKYSPGFIEKGLKYIENDGDKTRVYKIVIDTLTGKSKK